MLYKQIALSIQLFEQPNITFLYERKCLLLHSLTVVGLWMLPDWLKCSFDVSLEIEVYFTLCSKYGMNVLFSAVLVLRSCFVLGRGLMLV